MARRAGKESTVPVHEEVASVSKHAVERARVRVNKHVHTRTANLKASLLHEDAVVKRVAVNKVVAEAPAIRQEGDTLIVPLLEEVAVVERRLVLREEVHVRRHHWHEPFERDVTLRSEEAEIVKSPPPSRDTAGTRRKPASKHNVKQRED